MTKLQMVKRRELIAKAARCVQEGFSEVDYDRQGQAYNEAGFLLREARKLGCPRFSQEELECVRLAEEGRL